MNNYTKMNEEENKCIDKECMICFEEVNIKKDYIKCYNCEKLFHTDCMNDWRLRKNSRYSTCCIHCTKDDLIIHNFEPNCCVGCWNWIFPKQRKEKFTEIMRAYD